MYNPESLGITLPSTSTENDERGRLHREMLSTISHDLKTPLVSIIGSLEALTLLHETLPADKKLTLTQIALEEARRLNGLLTHIVDLMKFENKMITPTRVGIEINETIRECLGRWNGGKDAAIVDFKPSEKIEMTTDPVLLYQVLKLILENAAFFGTKPAVIRVTCGRQEENVFIAIKDNGPGIPEEALERIFIKYEKDPKSPGLGLGLAICRAIMELLGGTIKAGNDKEGGATFTLSLPA